ncbi:hypothetical protein [Brevibacillus nitrificans]|uniref:hypothetical protein n=1 Tax=Brevibacillus nitrificans TaxID=651560 RepID=UPI002858ABDE|nr:hypothetical protein [Brevibacillus nitrificans]MDR7314238.1 hypothetical protein [Brevibacillus nitrificans]
MTWTDREEPVVKPAAEERPRKMPLSSLLIQLEDIASARPYAKTANTSKGSWFS